MKLFAWRKDGGPESKVTGLFFLELKSLFTVVLLRFDPGTREAFHSHAFNSVSWILRGKLVEEHIFGGVETHSLGLKPIITRRSTFHRVRSLGTTWVISFRGPWTQKWAEYLPEHDQILTLTHGRRVVGK